MPCGVGNKENSIYDRGNRNQVERDSGGQRGTDKAESNGFWAPHYSSAKVSDALFYVKRDALIPRR